MRPTLSLLSNSVMATAALSERQISLMRPDILKAFEKMRASCWGLRINRRYSYSFFELYHPLERTPQTDASSSRLSELNRHLDLKKGRF